MHATSAAGLRVRTRVLLVVALMLSVMLGACSSEEHHTDKQAAMARMTFSPEKCETVGAVYYTCGGDHSLPGADQGMEASSQTNDTRMIRGVCPSGTQYENGACRGSYGDAPAGAAGN
jgi:hypothetical protein